MARRMRLESAAGVYHVLNRGNYRADVFQTERTKEAFLRCLGETCERTGWVVHAWCIMSNHYHLALSTPRANLVEGMCWLQGTFACRFNRFRREHGHLFQGRYKSSVVDPTGGLGPLCHYIHLNPVRARMRSVRQLRSYRWTSLRWLLRARSERPCWFEPGPALRHAGELADDAAGRDKYLEYLEWLAEDEPEQKRQRFDTMSRDWIIGSEGFVKTVVQEHRELTGQGPRLAQEIQDAREAIWQQRLDGLLRRSSRTRAELVAEGKSAGWKVAMAADLKAQTTVTNRWLSRNLHLGNLHEVSRKVAAWTRAKKPHREPKPT
jgi:putative transposase